MRKVTAALSSQSVLSSLKMKLPSTLSFSDGGAVKGRELDQLYYQLFSNKSSYSLFFSLIITDFLIIISFSYIILLLPWIYMEESLPSAGFSSCFWREKVLLLCGWGGEASLRFSIPSSLSVTSSVLALQGGAGWSSEESSESLLTCITSHSRLMSPSDLLVTSGSAWGRCGRLGAGGMCVWLACRESLRCYSWRIQMVHHTAKNNLQYVGNPPYLYAQDNID